MGHPKSDEYEPLRRDSSDRWSDESKETLDPASMKPRKMPRTSLYIRGLAVTLILLSMSLFTNIVLIIKFNPGQQTHKASLNEEDCPSTHAELKRDVPIQIYPSTEFTGDNLTQVRALWEELSGDPGVVALSEDYVQKKRLPHALRFPWDDVKGVYLLQGFHDLHCLRTLFRYVIYAELKQPQRIALSHALHCLDQLRQGVICNADDTPRYAGFQNPPGTGSGQVRMCRDWKKLEQWATERTACFKHEDEVPGPMIERFKSCPDGRVLWPLTHGANE